MVMQRRGSSGRRKQHSKNENDSSSGFGGLNLKQTLIVFILLGCTIVSLSFLPSTFHEPNVSIDLSTAKRLIADIGKTNPMEETVSDSVSSLSDMELMELVQTQNETISSLKSAIIKFHSQSQPPLVNSHLISISPPKVEFTEKVVAEHHDEKLAKSGVSHGDFQSWCFAALNVNMDNPPADITSLYRNKKCEKFTKITSEDFEAQFTNSNKKKKKNSDSSATASKKRIKNRRNAVNAKSMNSQLRKHSEGDDHELEEEETPKDGKPPIIYHGVNLVPPIHGLHADQDVTLLSMKGAVKKAQRDNKANVTIVAIEALGDLDYPLPDTDIPTFVREKTLRRTVLDSPHLSIYMTNASTPRRPLPLLTDILATLYEKSEGADYLVFTNADIGLQPDFYEHAIKLVRKRQAVAINRVEIPEEHEGVVLGVDTMDTILHLGSITPQNHHGFDCFVWRRELTPIIRLSVGMIAVGYPPIGNVLVDSLRCASPTFEIIKGARHTFHIGVKNGGWGLHRDQYEGYNRMCRKMGEALVIRAAELVNPSHSCADKDQSSDPSSVAVGQTKSLKNMKQKCGFESSMMDKSFCDLATGDRGLNDKIPIKRGVASKVSAACFKLRVNIDHTHGAAQAVNELRDRRLKEQTSSSILLPS